MNLRERWNNIWFAPVAASRIAVIRIALLGYLVLFELKQHYFLFDWSNQIAPDFRNAGVFLSFTPFPLQMTGDQIALFYLLLKIAGFCACIGLLTRPALVLFTLLYGHMLALESAWGWHDHGPSLIVQVLFVLCIAPGVASCSTDQLFISYRRRKRFDYHQPVPRWGLQMILTLVVVFYVASGTSKLRYGGFAWLNGKTLSFYLSGKSKSNKLQQFGALQSAPASERWKDGYGLSHYLYGAEPGRLGRWLCEQQLLCRALAIGAVLLEAGFFLVFLGDWLRRLLFLSAAMFHIGIYILMGIPFFSWLVLDITLLFFYQPQPVFMTRVIANRRQQL